MTKNNEKTQYEIRSADEPATRGETIIAAAIASVDFSKYTTLDAAERAVLKRISVINRRFMSPRSVAMRMQDAFRISATITNIEYEERTTRFIISFKADNKDDGKIETIRSDRTDNYNGEFVKAMWDKALIGKRVLLYKTKEETGKPDMPTCRIAVYVELL